MEAIIALLVSLLSLSPASKTMANFGSLFFNYGGVYSSWGTLCEASSGEVYSSSFPLRWICWVSRLGWPNSIIALLVIFLSLLSASGTMANFCSLFFNYGGFLLVGHPLWNLLEWSVLLRFSSSLDTLSISVGLGLFWQWIGTKISLGLSWPPLSNPSPLPPKQLLI